MTEDLRPHESTYTRNLYVIPISPMAHNLRVLPRPLPQEILTLTLCENSGANQFSSSWEN